MHTTGLILEPRGHFWTYYLVKPISYYPSSNLDIDILLLIVY